MLDIDSIMAIISAKVIGIFWKMISNFKQGGQKNLTSKQICEESKEIICQHVWGKVLQLKGPASVKIQDQG